MKRPSKLWWLAVVAALFAAGTLIGPPDGSDVDPALAAQWASQSSADNDLVCLTWSQDPEVVLAGFYAFDASGSYSRETVAAFYEEVC